MTEKRIYLKNGKVLTMGPSGIVDEGTIVINGSKIEAVSSSINIPSGSKVVDVEGCFVTPGLIDAHTHLGLNTFNEYTSPATPELRALDGLNPLDPWFKEAIKGGVTSVMVMPGEMQFFFRQTLNVIAGMGVVVKCLGDLVDEMVIRHPACMKIGLGDVPKRSFNPSPLQIVGLSPTKSRFPVTRSGVAMLLRKYLRIAKHFEEKAGETKNVNRDFGTEALCALLRREFPARIHAYRADDIFTAIRLSEEFGFEIILDHALEAMDIVGEISKRNIPIVYGPIVHGKGFAGLRRLSPETPARLHEKGVKVAITTDHPTRPIRYLTYHTAIAAREGLDWWEALKMITINPAEIMGVADRVGSIEKGKDADIVVFDDDPLEPLSNVKSVFIDGVNCYP